MRFLFRCARLTVLTVAGLWAVAAVFICVVGASIPYDRTDMAVVFGNALEADGTPGRVLTSRLDVALNCYRSDQCATFFVSGGIDGPGLDEAAAMRDYLVAGGVPADRIVVDNKGDNTLATARNAVAYMRDHGTSRVMLISQYYHLARAKLAFERAGASDIYAAFPHSFQLRDVYSSWREVPAYAVYGIRLALDPNSKPVSFRPLLYLQSLLSRSDEPGT